MVTTRIRQRALAAAGLTAALLLMSGWTGAAGTSDRVAAASRVPSLPAGGPVGVSRPFGGVPAVGAVFTERAGRLERHFCTASVVDSPAGDIAVSAAHCFDEISGPVVFVPGYDRGATPYGVWPVTAVYTSRAWRTRRDADDDVAFLRLAPAPDGVPAQDVTGAERLGADGAAHGYVQVVGYPDGLDRPVWCANQVGGFGPAQLRFECGGYTLGTSGSPFLADVSGPAGQGTVIGVIGGYQQGGDTADVSYSAAFGPAVAGLYRTAISIPRTG